MRNQPGWAWAGAGFPAARSLPCGTILQSDSSCMRQQRALLSALFAIRALPSLLSDPARESVIASSRWFTACSKCLAGTPADDPKPSARCVAVYCNFAAHSLSCNVHCALRAVTAGRRPSGPGLSHSLSRSGAVEGATVRVNRCCWHHRHHRPMTYLAVPVRHTVHWLALLRSPMRCDGLVAADGGTHERIAHVCMMRPMLRHCGDYLCC